MSKHWTVREVLRWMTEDFAGRAISTPRLDAELLIAHALGLSRIDLYLQFDRPLTPEEKSEVRSLVARRRDREPVAYILGRREFYGRSFLVSPAVLIPRPETELLAEQALARLSEDASGPLLDLGTGSGAIAVTLAAERHGMKVDAVDISSAALEVASANAAAFGLADRIRFMQGDLFEPVPDGKRYSMVVSNPPYIAEADIEALQPEIAKHEPRTALNGGDDGLAIIRRIVEGASRYLLPSGTLIMEVGAGQADAVCRQLSDCGFTPDVVADLARIDRVLLATQSVRPDALD